MTFLLRGSAGSNVTDDDVRAPRLSHPNPVSRMSPRIGTNHLSPDTKRAKRTGCVLVPPPTGVSVFAPTFHCPERDANRGSKALVALATPVQPRIFCIRRISLCAFRHRTPLSLFYPEREYLKKQKQKNKKQRARLSLAAVRNWAIT